MITITDTNFTAKVLESNGLTIVDFWAEWCGPCRALAPILDELAKQYAGKVTIGKLNIEENKEKTAEFAIRSIPTLLFFKDGKEVEKVIGGRSQSDLEALIKKHL